VRRDILEETFRLLARHLDLFTLIALTVWLPGHLVINYIDFFAASKDTADAAARGFRVGLMVEAIFGPLVVAATLAAVARIKRGEPASYVQALVDGLVAWPRIFIARIVVSVLVLAGLIALVVPGYIEALHIVARTELVAFVPSRLIAALAKPLSLTAVTPPLDPGIDEQFMFYPTRAQFDPGSIWLRKLMLETGRGLDRPKRRAV